MTASSSAYFERLSAHRYRPTVHVGGGWNPDEQHIAPALGLLAHLVEVDRDSRRSDGLQLGRLSYDILGIVPMKEFDVAINVARAGRTIELVEATMSHAGRAVVILRAWLLQSQPTPAGIGTPLPAIPPLASLSPWELGTVWPGGFVRSLQFRRQEREPGSAVVWARTDIALLDDEPSSPTSRLMGMVDVSNGISVRHSPEEVAFPNIDLTAHLFAIPRGEWIGFDTKVSFGPNGLGLTHTVLHDEAQPIGVVSQCLTVRPRA